MFQLLVVTARKVRLRIGSDDREKMIINEYFQSLACACRRATDGRILYIVQPQAQLSYLGGAGVEGGQGSNDYNYGMPTIRGRNPVHTLCARAYILRACVSKKAKYAYVFPVWSGVKVTVPGAADRLSFVCLVGSYDFSMRHGTRSSIADEHIPEYQTGDIWVSAQCLNYSVSHVSAMLSIHSHVCACTAHYSCVQSPRVPARIEQNP